MTTPITKKWLDAHGFVCKNYCRYEASLPNKVDSITIYYYYFDEDIDFWIESDSISVSGTLKENTAEELQKYINACNLSEEFLDTYRLNKKGDKDESK